MKLTKLAVSRPCGHCPFRSDVRPFIRTARVREIWEAAKRGDHFVCHETVDYDLPADAPDPGRRACAGFLIVARRDGLLDGLTYVQLAERLAKVSFHKLNGHDYVYRSVAHMIDAHEKAGSK